MAEKRKPDTVLWVRHTAGKSMKVELFKAAQFEGQFRHFTTKEGWCIREQDVPLRSRLRVDGVWYPAGQRFLFTQEQVTELLLKEIFSHENH